MNKYQLTKDTKAAKKQVNKPNPFFKDVIVTKRGQWDYPGQVTRIPSNQITMKNVPYPVLGIDDQGNQQMMFPEQAYQFPGNYVTEFPFVKGFGPYPNPQPPEGIPAFIPFPNKPSRGIPQQILFPNKLQRNGPQPVQWPNRIPENYNPNNDKGFDRNPSYQGIAFQMGGEPYQELELDDDQIAYYRSLGYRVEEL